MKTKFIILIAFLFNVHILKSQELEKPKFYINAAFGTQMSGYKKVDFVKSNYSPLIDLGIGKWFAPELAIQLGYNGWYFNTISNSDKRHYSFFYGKAIFSLNKLINRKKDYNWNFNIHLGSGYFYNYYYGRPNICASLEFSFDYSITKNVAIYFGISSIMGWDIYQNNEDILLGSKIGVNYLF
jgi:hypothetical protein